MYTHLIRIHFTSEVNLGTMSSSGPGIHGDCSMDSTESVVMINIELCGFEILSRDIESDNMVK